jgi:hypothetical protein
MFGVRSHRAARSLEPVFEDALKKLSEPKQDKPDPEMAKVQGELELAKQQQQMDLQTAQQKMQMDVQAEQQKQESQRQEEQARQQLEDQRSQREAERTAMLEKYKADLQAAIDREKFQREHDGTMEIERLKIESNERIAKSRPKEKAA